MKNKTYFVVFKVFLLCFIFSSCTNFFHSLLPPTEGNLINFQVQYENGSRSQVYSPNKNNNITIVVPNGTDVSNLIPIVTISEKAEIIPGDFRYLNKMFPGRDPLSLAVEMQKARIEGAFIDWFINLILENKGFEIPKLDMPVDFSRPVPFYVISGMGNYQIYTISVITEKTKEDIENSPYDPTKTEKNILSFEVENQVGTSIIDNTNCTVEFEISPDENINSILPIITVSDGAKPLPLTQNYLQACNFSFEQILDFYTGFTTATDLNRYISLYFQKQTNLILPELDIPMDFSSEILICVIAGDRSAKLYEINAKVDETVPCITDFAIGKSKNSFIIKDAEVTISENQINAKILYPVEMIIDYGIIPDLVFTGERITYKIDSGSEIEFTSGVTEIPFSESVNECTFIVYAKKSSVEYKLILDRQEDPDTIRSIIDYRFRKIYNSEIKSNVIASVYNEGDLGLVTATVLYEGDVAPYELIPEFITPGTLTLNGEEQISGVTKNSFEYSAEYLCTSKNGLYCRLYTIKIDFVKVVPAQAFIKSFTFSDYLNPGITQTTQAVIDELSKTIRIEVEYFGQEEPFDLIPQFSATGSVFVSNIEQTSGFTSQNFKYAQYYTVKSDEDSTVTKQYKVEVLFNPDPASACELTSFGFLQQDNQSLTKDVEARITQRDLSIFALMPYGSGAKDGIPLIPYFTAEGNVSVNGQTQISGVNSQDFSSEVIYTVTSSNGLYKKDYKVTLQESGDIIYVDINAIGRNNGTSWQDAFINLDLALEQAALMNADCAAEIWVTAPEDKTYFSKDETGFKLYKEGSITILGGFDGTEKNATERQFDSNGNLLKRTKIQNYNNGTKGIFECNDSVKDNVYIEGLVNTENNCNYFFDIGNTAHTVFIQSTITINDCEFYTDQISFFWEDSYDLTISNSKTRQICDKNSYNNRTYNIENCTFLDDEFAYIYLVGADIKFNNNTMYGYAKLNLESSGDVEFENNKLLDSDKIEKFQIDTFTNAKTQINEPVWYLYLKGNCNLVLNDKIFSYLYLGENTVTELNNCEFICAYIDGDFSRQFYSYGNTVVNDSVFLNKSICSYGNGSLTLNNCDVSISHSSSTPIDASGNLVINGGTYNLQATQDGNLIYVKGGLTITGGTFNFEHAGKYAPCLIRCDATISDATFNFTGDEVSQSGCLCFENSDSNSLINNCDILIDGCFGSGLYSTQGELTINESTIAIDIIPNSETSNCEGIYSSGDNFKILDSTVNINSVGNSISSSSSSSMQVENSILNLSSSNAYGIYNAVGTFKDSKLNINSYSNGINMAYDKELSLIDCETTIQSGLIEPNSSFTCSTLNAAIYIYGNLSVTGGSLDIGSEKKGVIIYAYRDTNLTIDNCATTILSAKEGIDLNDSLNSTKSHNFTFKNSSLTIKSDKFGIYETGPGNTEISNATLNISKNDVSTNLCGIYNDYGRVSSFTNSKINIVSYNSNAFCHKSSDSITSFDNCQTVFTLENGNNYNVASSEGTLNFTGGSLEAIDKNNSGAYGIDALILNIKDCTTKVLSRGSAIYATEVSASGKTITLNSEIRGISSNKVTLDTTTINIDSTDASIYLYGTLGTITCTNSVLQLTSDDNGIYCTNNDFIPTFSDTIIKINSKEDAILSTDLSLKNCNTTINTSDYGVNSSKGVIDGGTINVIATNTTSHSFGINCDVIKNANVKSIHKYLEELQKAQSIFEIQIAVENLTKITGSFASISATLIDNCEISQVLSVRRTAISADKIIKTKISSNSQTFGTSSIVSAPYIENCNFNLSNSYRCISAGDLTIKGGTYTLKTSSDNNFALFCGGTVNISGATFQNCEAGGPCLLIAATENVNIQNSTFIGCQNKASEDISNHVGGAMCINIQKTGVSVVVNKCTFKNNKIINKGDTTAIAQGGGGLGVPILANNVTLYVTNCTFDGNDKKAGTNGEHYWASNNWTDGNAKTGCNYSESGTTFTNPKDGRQGIINE